MSWKTFARWWIIAQVVGYLALAGVGLWAYTGLNNKLNVAVNERSAAVEHILTEIRTNQAENHLLLVGLTDYLQCLMAEASQYPPVFPARACTIKLGGGG